MPGSSRRAVSPLALAPLAAALLVLGLLVPRAASAAGPLLTASTALSPQLETLATPAVRSKSPAAQAEAIGVPAEGPGSLVREGGRVIVEARFGQGALARVEALKAAGARILLASRRYQSVSLSVEPEDLGSVAAVPGVAAVVPSRSPTFYGAGEGSSTAAIQSNGLCEGGSVISEGVAQLNVPAARAAFGARGAGETIGVLSDSFNSATTGRGGVPIASNAHGDEVTNDLPGRASTCSGQQFPVRVIEEAPPVAAGEPERTDEGRAMLQVIHDVAPHAKLAFATAYSTELQFARNIERLAEPVSAGGGGANVIVDDVGYFEEPFFQDGPVSEAIRKVREAGVTYLTSAGNENIFDPEGNEIASWEAPEYRPTECPAELTTLLGEASEECMNFAPSGAPDPNFGMVVEPGGSATLDLQWAEPWYGVETDLDAYLFNEEGQVLTDYEGGEGTEDSIALGRPFQLVSWENEGTESEAVFLVIIRHQGAGTPRLKFVFVGHSQVAEIEYPKSEGGDIVGPAINGHAGSAAAISVGAVRYTESSTAPKAPESYSSRGPVTHYFGPVAGTTPAAELTTPESLEKPNLTATDCASTTFFGRSEAGGWHFCGTSEASPHAGAVAALMQQTDPLASPQAIEAAMEDSATAYAPPSAVNGRDAVGAGLLNALAAMKALGGSPVEDPPSYVVPSLEEEEKAPAPTVQITKGPKALGKESRPTFEFTSSRPVSFSCQVDGGTSQPCASPYLVPSSLADGSHGFSVTGTDAEGRTGSSGVYSFTIDTKAPRTKIVGHPKKVMKTRKRSVVARFKLKASESSVTYYCQFDKEPLRICTAQFRHRFAKGKHAVRVRAKDQAGNLADKPTVFHFRVKELPPKHRAKAHRSR
jgi:hypothetical protein